MARPKAQKKPDEKLVTLSIRVPPEIADRVRNAIYFTPGASLVGIGSEALRREIDRLERANGGPFKDRGGVELRRGRRSVA